MRHFKSGLLAVVSICFGLANAVPAVAQSDESVYGQHNRAQAQPSADAYSQQEVLSAGHQFFGSVSGSVATFVEKVFSKHGQPNGYILGQEGSGIQRIERMAAVD